MFELSLFGTPVLVYNNRSLHIPRRKARALLAYLAVSQKSHTREGLVAFLWPEYDQRSGRADLSRILSTLRKVLGEEYFLTDRENVALNDGAWLWVDVVHFRRKLDGCREATKAGLDDECLQQLEDAVRLYKSDFLAGFTLPDCPAFDEWQLLQTEALRRDLSGALDQLVHIYEAHNDLTQAIAYAQRWVELDPLHELSQQKLIALYARNGQRAEAYHQYHTFKRLLAEEIGVEPQPETQQVYEQIKKHSYVRSLATPTLSKKPEGEVHGLIARNSSPEDDPPFVARTQELGQLDRDLEDVLKGNGRIVFVTGGAGRGKTSLLDEFARRAQRTHSNIIVACGNGNALGGVGDPYLPFREVISMLTGDFTMRRPGGQISIEQARRIWALLPQTIHTILEHGPQLLDSFVSAKQLLARAVASTPTEDLLLSALKTEVTRRQVAPAVLQQNAIFGQWMNVLDHLAQENPLLITLDDLQWMDEASIGLLFHVGRRLAGCRILIVGAYRPDELTQGRDGEPHPLVQVIEEFKRIFGSIFIDLASADQVAGKEFVEAYLDIEPNRLDKSFRNKFFQRTGGHPLFTVELLRDMQSRGDLVRDETGHWCVGNDLDWETFPARVEAVIARRVDRLDGASRAILKVASIEGELFSAEVVARVLGMEMRPFFDRLSDQLRKQHRLVLERGEQKAGTGYISKFQFSHALFQQYLYRQISPSERRRLHGEVAGTLAAIYADDLDQVVVQLAYHYTVAEDWERAVTYQVRAGDLAYRTGSLLDAVRHYRSSLTHWSRSDKVGRARILRKIGECQWILGQQMEAAETLNTSYSLSLYGGDNQGAGAAQRLLGRVYWELGEQGKASSAFLQALTILEGGPESEELAWALAGMSNYYMQIGEYDESIKLGERALSLARSLDASEIIIQCLCDLGSALSSKGDWKGLAMEQESLERALALNRPHDAGRAYVYISEALIYLGQYSQGRNTLMDAVTYTRRMQVPYITEAASRMLAEIDWLTGRWSTAIHQLELLGTQADGEQPWRLPQLYLAIVYARLYNDLGQAKKAHQLLTNALAGHVDTLDPHVALLGEFLRAEEALGHPAAAAAAAAEILEWTDRARHLYPTVGMPLLFVCRSPNSLGRPELIRFAGAACQRLERLDRQYGTPATAACYWEGLGWLSLAEADITRAAASFKQAAAQWRDLDHPYDHARALSGLGYTLTKSGDRDGAKSASDHAMALVDTLTSQLEDPALKTSFLDSGLVQEIRAIR
jgi:DNA-binding SARP family transcriptional activator